MLAKQYTIKLPADYDMEIIRRRVRDRGDSFDGFPGLTLKAFLITERAAGASANRYAPFYVWHDTDGTNQFLYGDGFAALQKSFGRPLIEHWIGLAHVIPDQQHATQPRSATRQDLSLVDSEELAEVRDRELAWLEQCRSDPRGAHAAVSALDPYRWTLVRFALWHAPLSDHHQSAAHTGYEVLHLSTATDAFTSPQSQFTHHRSKDRHETLQRGPQPTPTRLGQRTRHPAPGNTPGQTIASIAARP